jgi:hypothetical protein
MNCKSKLIAFLFFFSASIQLNSTPIKHIFIDITTIVKTSATASSQIIGIINSMKYTAVVGHIPSKIDFFRALKNVPALTDQHTYNEDILMPAILCDWLLGLQSNNAVRSAIYKHLDKSSLSDIEVTIFKNITSMMMSPTMFIDTQYAIKDFSKILQNLKKAGYTIYLIGNWDKESEPFLIKFLHENHFPDSRHCYFSNKAKQLKPNSDYFDQLLKHYNLNKNECLIIDIEKNHAQSARNQGFSTILLHGNNPTQLKYELTRLGIRI